MIPVQVPSPRHLRVAPSTSNLAHCLGAALALMGAPVAANTLQVTDCGDDGPGTLRQVVASAAAFDTVDIDSAVCGTITLTTGEIPIDVEALTISGVHGYPTVSAANVSRILRFDGDVYLKLFDLNLTDGTFQRGTDAKAAGGCIYSSGTVATYGVHLSNCSAIADHGPARGGAIYAKAILFVESTVSTSLAASALGGARGGGLAGAIVEIGPQSQTGTVGSSVTGNIASGFYEACGGGIFAAPIATYGGQVTVGLSVISGNAAITTSSASSVQTMGGGICSTGNTFVNTTSITGNVAQSSGGTTSGAGIFASSFGGFGRGVFLYDTVADNTIAASAGNGAGAFLNVPSTITYSLFDHNQAANNAALVLTQYPTNLFETTIANNVSTGSSAVFASAPITIHNSTIAFNQSGGSSAGLYLYPGGSALLQSVLIAGNTSTNGVGFDIVARDTITGDHNLIQVPEDSVPPDTIVGVDPQLLPLADNGGGTLTAALRSTSPAVDEGGASTSEWDQRGQGFPRTFGVDVDIGAFEWQGGPDDPIFGNGFDP